jgi:GNAT superfamily N-acetyltransferase
MRAQEFLYEYRDRLLQYVKSLLPTWPEYVLKDWLVPNKGDFSNLPDTELKNGVMEKIKGAGLSVDTKWQLVPNMKFTMDMFEPLTTQRLIGRSGGHSDMGLNVPRDKERHATQAALAQQQGGVRKEPVLLIKTAKGYELLEGWHRTIQHFAKYPNGYTGPAYVAVAQGQQGVAENFADGKNPVKFTVTTPDGYTHSFQITLAVHGKHVGHFNFVRSADTDDVNNEAEVEQRWQGQGYGKLLLMKAIDVANNHGLDFQQDIRGITDAQQNVYDSLENAGLIITPGDGFWFLTPQGEQELNGLNENFADGKNPGRKGLSKRVGVNTKASVSSLRKTAKNSSGEKQRMAHWLANMKAGRAKAKRK